VRVARLQPRDELDEVEVAGRDEVVTALAVEAEHLDRPAPDARDRAQPPPAVLVVGGEQVRAARGDLARGAPQRERAAGGEVEALQQRRRRPRQGRGIRQVAQPRRGATAAETEDDPALDLDGPREFDELLGDGPRERLERVGPAVDPQPRPQAHRRPDERVAPEAVVERAQVVVDAEREAHPHDRLLRGGAVVRAGAEEDLVGGDLGDAHDRGLALDVDEPFEDPAVSPQDAVARAAGEAEDPARADGLADLGHRPPDAMPAGRRRPHRSRSLRGARARAGP